MAVCKHCGAILTGKKSFCNDNHRYLYNKFNNKLPEEPKAEVSKPLVLKPILDIKNGLDYKKLDNIRESIITLKEAFPMSQVLIEEAEVGYKLTEQQAQDYKHKLENCEFESLDLFLEFSNAFRETLIKRRFYKESLILYKIVKKFTMLENMDIKDLTRYYTERCGGYNKIVSGESFTEELLQDEYKEYIQVLHNTPIPKVKNKQVKPERFILFQKHNLNDLKAKHTQNMSKYKAFRVEDNCKLFCYN